LLGAVMLKKNAGGAFPATQARTQARWAQLYAALPLSFEANHGQTHPSVNYITRGKGYALFLTRDEAVLSLRRSSPAGVDPSSPLAGRMPGISKARRSPATAQLPAEAVLRMQLIGANPA